MKAKSGLTFCIALLAVLGYWWFVRPPGLSRIGYSQNLAETAASVVTIPGEGSDGGWKRTSSHCAYGSISNSPCLCPSVMKIVCHVGARGAKGWCSLVEVELRRFLAA